MGYGGYGGYGSYGGYGGYGGYGVRRVRRRVRRVWRRIRRVRRRIRRVRSRSVRSVDPADLRTEARRRPGGRRSCNRSRPSCTCLGKYPFSPTKHASASFLHHVAVAIVGSRRASVRRALSRYSQGDGVPRTTETAPTAVRRAAGRARGRWFSRSRRVSSPRTERERGVVRGRVGKRRRAIVATNIVNQRTRTNERRERTNEPTSRTESLRWIPTPNPRVMTRHQRTGRFRARRPQPARLAARRRLRRALETPCERRNERARASHTAPSDDPKEPRVCRRVVAMGRADARTMLFFGNPHRDERLDERASGGTRQSARRRVR